MNSNIKKTPKNYQKSAIENVIQGFKEYDRGKLIMPCASGKTLISLWVWEKMTPLQSLILFPSLALLRQTKDEWKKNSKKDFSYLCVCSEKNIDLKNDALSMHISEIDRNVTTNPSDIFQFLAKNKKSVLFSTYQSLDVIHQAIKNTPIEFDIAICDEAHKTASNKSGLFNMIHDNNLIPVNKRLYMTATPKVFKGYNSQNDDSLVYSMDNPSIYGPEFHKMTFQEAIERKILCDYKIVIIGISKKEMENDIDTKLINKEKNIFDLMCNYALNKFMTEYKVNNIITFHSSIRKAEKFKNRHIFLYNHINTLHICGLQNTSLRNSIIDNFKEITPSILTNSRCLTEGIDIPEVDTIFFCDPKNSKIDIIQALGRALRLSKKNPNKIGYILIPIFNDENEEIITENNYAFSNILNVVSSLNQTDERFTKFITNNKTTDIESKNENQRNENYINNHIEIIGNIKNKENLFIYKIMDKIKEQYLSFEEVREVVHSLKLKSKKEWMEYCKSGNKPSNIPCGCEVYYKEKGWKGYGDFLGTNNLKSGNKKFISFEEARKFIIGVNLKSAVEWREYCKSGNKPSNIPTVVSKIYSDKWKGWGDFLGTNTISNKNKKFIEFEEARQFVRELNLKNVEEWIKYSKSINKPKYIPVEASKVYKNKGWRGWPDFLGNNNTSKLNKKYLPFEEAVKFSRSLNLNNQSEWYEVCKKSNKNPNIPISPHVFYKNKGWKGWLYWLGNEFMTFEEARNLSRSLNVKSKREWMGYARDKSIKNMPYNPDIFYKEKGWSNWRDFLDK